MQIAETERLRLRHFVAEDLPALQRLMSNKEVMRHALSGPLTDKQVKQFLDGVLTTYQKQGFSLWAVELKQSGDVIGFCGHFFQRLHGHNEIELTYRLLPEFWGIGLASEAASCACDYAFVHLRIPRLIAFIAKRNEASIRVAEKLDFEFWQSITIAEQEVLIYRRDSPVRSG